MAIFYLGGRENGKILASIRKLAELNEPVIVPSERYKEIIEKEARELGIDIPELILGKEEKQYGNSTRSDVIRRLHQTTKR